jgi:hypothetical protein
MAFLWGALGGALMELLRWWKLRESLSLPVYMSSPLYWVTTFAMIIAGGFVAWAYSSGNSHAIELINLGAATPAIIGALAKNPKDTGENESKSFDGSTTSSNAFQRFLSFG